MVSCFSVLQSAKKLQSCSFAGVTLIDQNWQSVNDPLNLNPYISGQQINSRTNDVSPCPSQAWSWWSDMHPGGHSHSCLSWRRQQSGCWTGRGLKGQGPKLRCSSVQPRRCSPHSAPCYPGLSMLKPASQEETIKLSIKRNIPNTAALLLQLL